MKKAFVRFFALTLSAVLGIFALTACGQSADSAKDNNGAAEQIETKMETENK